eukprot:TRINITY_DN10319_c0_g1_i1.p1 TRINITY_DN10319_c0_g1~~TRINITY_DN10319_c0_g1_i1.p1  ORF type:complete len:331 (-),score=59.24 TRINITY_DN10319_c0_g1_i1:282-1274(-)
MSVFGIPYGAPYKAHQKFRQEQLILNEIPEKEYQRLSNGKYSCAVCSQIGRTTVFDTPQMLQVHRQSKKHQEALEEIEALKREKKIRLDKEKDRIAAQQEAQHIQSAIHARHIASQYAHQNLGAIGVAGPQPDSVTATEDSNQDIVSPNTKKRKEATADDPVAPLGSFSGMNHPATLSQQQHLQPVYKRTKTGNYIEVDQQKQYGVNAAVNPAAYPTMHHQTPSAHAAAYYPNYYGYGYPSAPQSVFMASSDEGPPPQTPSNIDPTLRISKYESARAKYFALLRERGWLQNGHGQWYRDPNVEFEDDDELPPPAPPGLDIVIEIVSAPSS